MFFFSFSPIIISLLNANYSSEKSEVVWVVPACFKAPDYWFKKRQEEKGRRRTGRGEIKIASKPLSFQLIKIWFGNGRLTSNTIYVRLDKKGITGA